MPIDVWEGTEIVCRGFRPWCCDTGSSSHFTKLVTSSNPHGPSVTDPCLTCRRCSHPHAHHTLACPSTGKDELSRWRWSDTHTCTTRSLSSPLLRADTRFLLASRTYFSFSLSLSGFLSPSFLSPPLSFHFSRLCFPPQNGPPIHFISVGRLRGGSPPQAHPAPLAHNYYDDPCALKKDGHKSSRKKVAEEK